MEHSIKNEFLSVVVNHLGAELSSIKRLSDGKEYMWNAQPDVWGSSAPVLFPVIGSLKNNSYHLDGKTYQLPKHGIVRNNNKLILKEIAEDRLTLTLLSDEDSLKMYPFKFEFNIQFILENKTIRINHKVVNQDTKNMLFTLGAHPAFVCPIEANEDYEDYFLEFEKSETVDSFLLDEQGLLSGKTVPALINTNILPVRKQNSIMDAFIFKNLKSDFVTLCSSKTGKKIRVSIAGFPYLTIWSKPGGSFVCIEPWIGVADFADTDGDFAKKDCIVLLEPSKSFDAEYRIEIL